MTLNNKISIKYETKKIQDGAKEKFKQNEWYIYQQQISLKISDC